MSSSLKVLAGLAANDDITPDQRDAGEIYHHLGRIALSDTPSSTQVSYKWRYKTGAWSVLFVKAHEARKAFRYAEEAISTPAALQVTNLLLTAREARFHEDNIELLSLGLTRLTRHFWGAAGISRRNGVSLASVGGIDTATPERLAKAANDNVKLPGNLTRLTDWPFHRMYSRGQLDPDNGVNEDLYAAGFRYYTDWYHSGMSSYSSPDMSRPIVDQSHQSREPIGEQQLIRRRLYREARAVLGDRFREVVEPIVLEDKTAGEIAFSVTRHKSEKQAVAVTMERLNNGLRVLSSHYRPERRRAA